MSTSGDRGGVPGPEYVLGHSGDELNRLAVQGRLVKPITRRFFEEAGIAAGMHVLDVGSGVGDVSFLVADLVGETGHVVGVDRADDAVATASERAAALALDHVCSFEQGELADLVFKHRFDAIVGRYVLMFQPDPAEALRSLLQHVEPDGLVVFHEPEWTRARSVPAVPSWQRCCDLVVATATANGVDMEMGMKLAGLFEHVGLPAPSLRMSTVIGAGANCSDVVHFPADGGMRVLAQAQQAGLVEAGEIDPATYAERLIADVRESGSVVIGRAEVGAWSHRIVGELHLPAPG